jgi:hypothetical protein
MLVRHEVAFSSRPSRQSVWGTMIAPQGGFRRADAHCAHMPADSSSVIETTGVTSGMQSTLEGRLIVPDESQIQVIGQPDNGWLLSDTNRMEDTIALGPIGCTLGLSEI